jgi:hypothetical protein
VIIALSRLPSILRWRPTGRGSPGDVAWGDGTKDRRIASADGVGGGDEGIVGKREELAKAKLIASVTTRRGDQAHFR